MKNQKMYEADDQMISLIRDNYNILQSLGSFGLSLGFGDKTVRQVCDEQNVDCYTFLAVVNFTINGYTDVDNEDKLSLSTLLHYLKAVFRRIVRLDQNNVFGHHIIYFYNRKIQIFCIASAEKISLGKNSLQS